MCTVFISLIGLGIVIVAEYLYKKAMLDFSLDPDKGIPYIQKSVSEGLKDFLLVETAFGGGKELMLLTGICFLWLPREKFFYFLGVLSIDKLYVSYFKLAYADPRPYMI